jgi:ATP synthase protein I
VKNRQSLRGLSRLFCVQVLLIVLGIIVCSATNHSSAAASVLVGGLVSSLPQMFFGWLLFRGARIITSKETVRRVYRGEMFKIALSVLLFAGVFCYLNIQPVVFFVTYIIVQMTVFFVPWVFINKKN